MPTSFAALHAIEFEEDERETKKPMTLNIPMPVVDAIVNAVLERQREKILARSIN